VGRELLSELVSHAADLEQQDSAIAVQLGALAELADRAAGVRTRAAAVREALERIPPALDELDRLGREADSETEAARQELGLAEERLAALARGRRHKRDETERARREAETARQRLVDAEANVERLHARGEQLRADARAHAEEDAALARSAASIATDLRRVPRVAADARRDPGETLAELEDWGQLVRSALFVARGTLEAERERVVAEANALGASVLGEQLGASSVALVRQRLENELA
jgi:chromosome segregation ATPase